MGPDECTEELGLDRIRDKAWSIWSVYSICHTLVSKASLWCLNDVTFLISLFVFRPSNALSGEGVDAGIEWLANNIGNRHK